jgi:hypothetical protein
VRNRDILIWTVDIRAQIRASTCDLQLAAEQVNKLSWCWRALVPNKNTLASARYLWFCNISYSTSTDSYAFAVIPDRASHANFIKGRSLEKGTYWRSIECISFWYFALSTDLAFYCMFSWNISALRITFWSLIFNCLAIISLPGPGPEPMFFYADAFLQGHEFCRLYLQELRNSEWSWTSWNRSDIFPCLLTCSHCVLCKKVVWTRFLAQYIIHAISFMALQLN